MMNAEVSGTSGSVVLRIVPDAIEATLPYDLPMFVRSRPEITDDEAVVGAGLRDSSTDEAVNEAEQAASKLFAILSEQWKQEAGRQSIISKIVMNPAYQHIIAMGMKAVPYILRDLEKSPNHW